jgi:hypothetical protein
MEDTEKVMEAIATLDVPEDAEGNIPQEGEEVSRDKQQKALFKPMYTSKLAAYIRKGFNAAQTHRSTSRNKKPSIDTRLIQSKRQVDCVYDPEILAQIEKFGGSTDFDPLTIQKCLTAEAWIKDIMSPTDDKPWTIDPSPIPDLPEEAKAQVEKEALKFYEKEIPQEIKESEDPEAPEIIGDAVQEKASEARDIELRVMQDEAKKRANRMEKRIYDQLVDGEFMLAFEDFIENLSRNPIGILKGPVLKKKKSLVYQKMDNTWDVGVEDRAQQYYYAPDPQNVYFSGNALSIDSCDVFEIMPIQTSSLQDLIGIEGYKEESIREVLRMGRIGVLKEWTNNRWENDAIQDRNALSGGDDEYNSEVDAIDFWGKVPGRLLREWGMTSDLVPDKDLFYDVHAILIGTEVILSELNPHKLGRRPYHITSFEKQANSLYGRGIPEKVRSAQKGANMVRRSLINNVAIASGPQVVVNSDALPQGEVVTQMHPWKIWQTKYLQGIAQKPVDFFQPNDNSQNLVSLLEKFYNDADRDTGIPRYVQGDQNAAMRGAAGTASGLSMLMNAASKSMKRVLTNIDIDILKRVIEYQYDLNMRDPNVPQDEKGDFNIRVRGSLALAIKEQLQQARAEFMQLVLSNETLFNIVGKKGIVALLREITKGLDMPTNSLIPSDSELEQGDMNEAQQMFMQVIQGAVGQGVIDEQQAQMLLNPEMMMQEAQQAA